MSALLDGELSPDEERDTVRHLSTCRACSAFRDRLVGDRSAFLTVLNRAASAAATAPVLIPRKYAAAASARRGWGRRESWYLAAGLAAGLIVGLVLAYSSRRNPPIDAGKLVAASGEVDLVNSAAVTISVSPGLPVRPQRVTSFGQPVPAWVRTGPGGAAVVVTADGSRIEIAEDTQLRFDSSDHLTLDSGRVSAELPDPRPPTEFVISTAACDFVAVGTVFSVISNRQGYWLVLERGQVLVRRNDRELVSRQVQTGAPAAIYHVSSEGRVDEVPYSSSLPPEVLGAIESGGERVPAAERLGR